jgi:hypothetical protein
MFQRSVQVRKLEREACGPGSHWDHSLPVHQQLRHLSQPYADKDRGNPHPHGAVEDFCQQALHLRMRSGRGRYGVYSTFARRGVEREFEQTNEVADMDPRYPLFAAADDGAKSESHRQREWRQGSAAASENKSDTQLQKAAAPNANNERSQG